MSCTGARITQVAETVAATLGHEADPAAGITVEREYAPDWLNPDFWKDNPNLANKFTGRRLYVFGATQKQVSPADRGADLNEYGIAVVVMERYVGDEPVPPRAWVDERVAWVEANVYDRLGDARDNELPAGVWPDTQEWTAVYDPGLLRSHKLFRSEVTLGIRRVDAG